MCQFCDYAERNMYLYNLRQVLASFSSAPTHMQTMRPQMAAFASGLRGLTNVDYAAANWPYSPRFSAGRRAEHARDGQLDPEVRATTC